MVLQDSHIFFTLFVISILASHVKSYILVNTSNELLRTLYETNEPDMTNGIYSSETSMKNLCYALRLTTSSDGTYPFQETKNIRDKTESAFANANIKIRIKSSLEQTLHTKNCQLSLINGRDSTIFLAAPPPTFRTDVHTSTNSVVALAANGPDKVGAILGVIYISGSISQSFPKQPTQTNEGTSTALRQTIPPGMNRQIIPLQGTPMGSRPIYQQPRPYSQSAAFPTNAQAYPQSRPQRGQSSAVNNAPVTRNPTEFIDFMGPSQSDLQGRQQKRARTSPDTNVTNSRYPTKTYDFMGLAPSQPNLQGEQPKRTRFSQQQDDATPSTQNDSPPKTLDLAKWGK